MSKTKAPRTYPRPGKDGGTMAEGIIDAVGQRLAFDLAVHASNETECHRLIMQARLTVGDAAFPRALYVAVCTQAFEIVGPMLEAADSVGWFDARRLVSGRAARQRRVVDKAVGKP